MTDPYPDDWLCLPCKWAKHDACLGSFVYCCCLAETLMEAEDADEGRDQ